jgi:hypothetical protein
MRAAYTTIPCRRVAPRLAVEDVCRPGKLFDALNILQCLNFEAFMHASRIHYITEPRSQNRDQNLASADLLSGDSSTTRDSASGIPSESSFWMTYCLRS